MLSFQRHFHRHPWSVILLELWKGTLLMGQLALSESASVPVQTDKKVKGKTTKISKRAASEDELNLRHFWSHEEVSATALSTLICQDEIVVEALNLTTPLSHQLEDIRHALLRAGFDRSAGAIKYRWVCNMEPHLQRACLRGTAFANGR